jgi:hypothetical protein
MSASRMVLSSPAWTAGTDTPASAVPAASAVPRARNARRESGDDDEEGEVDGFMMTWICN